MNPWRLKMDDEDRNCCVGCICVMFFILLGGIAVYVAMRCGWIS